MTEFWRWFLVVGGGLIFIISVLDSAIRGFRYLKKGNKSAKKSFNDKVLNAVREDRKVNCPWILSVEREHKARESEMKLLKEAIIGELKPIQKDIEQIKEITTKLHHSQMTDLQIKLNHLFHEKFDKKGTFTKAEQSNWDKWYSDYAALGGNSDIKRMDELIQAARIELTLGKTRKNKEERGTNEN